MRIFFIKKIRGNIFETRHAHFYWYKSTEMHKNGPVLSCSPNLKFIYKDKCIRVDRALTRYEVIYLINWKFIRSLCLLINSIKWHFEPLDGLFPWFKSKVAKYKRTKGICLFVCWTVGTRSKLTRTMNFVENLVTQNSWKVENYNCSIFI